MTLSCSCGSDWDQWTWWSWPADDLAPMPTLRRRRRCAAKSCRRLINPGEPVLEFRRTRMPRSDLEYTIYGEEVPMASHWLCEVCADLYWSITRIMGAEHRSPCVAANDDLREAARELAKMQAEQRVGKS